MRFYTLPIFAVFAQVFPFDLALFRTNRPEIQKYQLKSASIDCLSMLLLTLFTSGSNNIGAKSF